jgi:hypothetical protein
VLKLVYHSAAFGPIDLEYDRPLIRVGSSEDNDLVLRHHSVKPRHCLLLFRGEKLVLLPPSDVLPTPTEMSHVSGEEFGLGDLLTIGDLEFSLAHSPTSVILPETAKPEQPDQSADTADDSQYYCPNCRTAVRAADVKRVGLVGHAKRNLCPKCSRVLDAVIDVAESRPEVDKPLPQRGFRRVIGNYQARLLGRKSS